MHTVSAFAYFIAVGMFTITLVVYHERMNVRVLNIGELGNMIGCTAKLY